MNHTENPKPYSKALFEAVSVGFRDFVGKVNGKLSPGLHISGWSVGHTSCDEIYIVISSIEEDPEPFSEAAISCRKTIIETIGKDLLDFGSKYPILGIGFLPIFYTEGKYPPLNNLDGHLS